MFRSLAVLAVIGAAIALSSCDNPATGILSTARPGECYAVTGKDSLGQPKMIRTECGSAGATTTVAAPPVQTASTAVQCPAPVAPVAAPCCPSCGVAKTYAYHAPAKRKWSARKVWRRATGHYDNTVAVSGEVVPSSGYTYPRPYETELAGGHSYNRVETYSTAPAPVYAPPPAPLPPVYIERREADDHESERRSYSSESSSSSSSSASSASGYGSSSRSASSSRRKPCNCSRDRDHHVVYEEYDRADGYLVWQGKARR